MTGAITRPAGVQAARAVAWRRRDAASLRPGPRVRTGRLRAWATVALLVLAWVLPGLQPAVTAAPPARLHVVSDDNFPPYLFRTADGTVTGYLVDYWKLWERKTGVPVTLTATRWEDAQKRLLAGEADVIDMIYRTPAREPLYDFTAPYAEQPVPIYAHRDITGITGVETLKGFRVGVQAGDACIDELARHGITAPLTYPNYAALLQAAQQHEFRVFCLDQSPADFYLARMGLDREYLRAFTLYSGRFHRAVREGRTETLRLVERGMAAVTAAELRALDEQWLRASARRTAPWMETRHMLWAAGGLAAAGGVALGWLLALRRRVATATRELRHRNDELLERGMALAQSEQRRAASQEQLQLALESAQAGAWSWDPVTDEAHWSAEVWRLFGLETGHVASRQAWLGSVDERDRCAVQDTLAQAVAAGTGFEITWRVRGAPPERPRWLMTRGRPRLDAAGAPVGYQGIVIDITERKVAEEAQEMFVHAFYDSPTGKVVSRLDDGRIVEVNEAFCRLSGFARDALVGRTSPELGLWDDPADRSGLVDDLRRHGALHNRPLRVRTRGGALRVLLATTHLAAYRGETCMFTTLVDMTEQEAAQAALRESQARLRALFDTLPDVVCLRDPHGALIACNRRFEALVGAKEADIAGCRDLAFPSAELTAALRAHGAADPFPRRPTVDEVELTFASDGHRERLQILTAAVIDADGDPVGVLCVGRDITELNRTAQELARHREQLEQLVEQRTRELSAERRRLSDILAGTGAGTWEWDVVADTVVINERWADMLGRTQAELEPVDDATWRGLLHPQDLAAATQALQRHFAGETPSYACEFRMQHRDGHWVWVLARGKVASRGADGQPLLVSGTHLDISTLKAAQDALQRAKDAAEAAAQAKGRFLANMSHEIRTPLNGVLGLAQIGHRDSVGLPQAQATFARILDSGRMLLAIVNDILDFSKIEAGKLEIEAMPLDPARLVEEAAQGVAELASSKSLSLVVRCDGLPPAVLGDPLRLSQVLYNLLSNAIKFTERGEVQVTARALGDELAFSVRDTSIGIAPEALARLFQPFEQADGSITRRFGGSGLGLAICHRLAEMMGGGIDVHSTPGAGSTFTLRLPLRPTDQPVPGRAAPDHTATRRLQGLRLLVAEDNAVNQLVIEHLLRTEGAEVVLAETGGQALAAVARAAQPFDAVLMDVQMPEMDGLEATRRLRGTHPALPVIGQSAHALKEEVDQCLQAGMAATVQKPIEFDLLVSTLLDKIRRPGPPVPAPARDEPAGEVAAVDWPALLARYAGRPGFVERLAGLFAQRHAADAGRLRALALADDLAGIEALAHELKGSAGSIGALAVERLAATTLRLARQRDAAAAGAADALAAALDLALAALRRPPHDRQPQEGPDPE